MNRFEGRTVLITGGGSGIGAAAGRMFLGEGALVVLADVDGSAAERIAADLNAPDRVMAVAVDVSDRDRVDLWIAGAMAQFGKLDVLVNCAGIRGGNASGLELAAEDWKAILDINLGGTFNACQAFARAVAATSKPASIVNLSSTASLWSRPNRAAYGTSKHGVSGLTKQLAMDFGPVGIRINAVAPGTIRTPMTAAYFEIPDREAEISRAYPLGRIGEPEEVASVILFLASDEASFITGAILPIDGGYSAGKTW